MRKLAPGKAQREPTIALINIVFLMLVFFMVAGTLSQPLDRTLELVRTADLDGHAPPDALVIHPDGRLAYRQTVPQSAAAFMASLAPDQREVVRIVPDRTLPAAKLVTIARDLRAAGAQRVLIVTERGIP
jgi:biopolymer transport protein ExbD